MLNDLVVGFRLILAPLCLLRIIDWAVIANKMVISLFSVQSFYVKSYHGRRKGSGRSGFGRTNNFQSIK